MLKTSLPERFRFDSLFISGLALALADYTKSLILPVKNMLCSEPHCQKGFNLISFSNQVWP